MARAKALARDSRYVYSQKFVNMKRQEIKELQEKSEEALKKLLVETRDEVAKIKLDIILKKAAKPSQMREKKKLIARIMTFLGQKEEAQKIAK